MKSRSSLIIAFLAGAIVAATPFLLSSRPTLAKGPTTFAETSGTSMVIDGDSIYIAKPNKLYKVSKSGFFVDRMLDLN